MHQTFQPLGRQLGALALLVASGFAPASWAVDASNTLKPEEVAALFIKTFVNDDGAAGKALNHYLKPEFDGKDAYEPAMLGNLQKLGREQWERYLPQMLKENPSKMKRDDLSAGLRAMFMASQWQAKHARCEVGKATISPNKEMRNVPQYPQADLAEVAYSCSVPVATQATADHVKQLIAGKNGRAFRQAAESYLTEIKSGAQSQSASGSKSLYNTRTPGSIWHSGGPDEWLEPVQSLSLHP